MGVRTADPRSNDDFGLVETSAEYEKFESARIGAKERRLGTREEGDSTDGNVVGQRKKTTSGGGRKKKCYKMENALL